MTKEGMMRVVLLEPDKLAKSVLIDSSLEGMQKVVGGYIEAFYPFEDPVAMVLNEEGKLIGLPLNRAVYAPDKEVEMAYSDLKKLFREFEAEGTDEHIKGYIVFSADSFDKEYSEKSRTYVISSDNKAFHSNMGGYSIFGSALDGSDKGVRLEALMADEHGGANGWKIERCYIKEPSNEIVDIIAGTCFICDCSGENFASLSDEQARRYEEMFKLPETFFRDGRGKIFAVPYVPEDLGQKDSLYSKIENAESKTAGASSEPGKDKTADFER